jgi:hypothetical protein
MVVAARRGAVNTLCRDCGALEIAAHRSERCAACGSPRLICHAELGSLAVAHVDCDAFYAAVEKARQTRVGGPKLAAKSSFRSGCSTNSGRHCELTTGRAADRPSMKPPPERFPGEKPGSMQRPAERSKGGSRLFAGEAF